MLLNLYYVFCVFLSFSHSLSLCLTLAWLTSALRQLIKAMFTATHTESQVQKVKGEQS